MKRIAYAREDFVNNVRVVPSRNVFDRHIRPGFGHLVLSFCSENNGPLGRTCKVKSKTAVELS